MIRCFRGCDLERFVEDLSSAPWHVMESLENMDCRWEYWKKLFREIVDSHVLLKKGEEEDSSMDHSGCSCIDEVKKLLLH